MADDISAYKGCKKAAQKQGAVVTSIAGCVVVYGKRIEIGPDNDDIQKAFEIINFNFHVNGSRPALPSPELSVVPVQGVDV